MNNPVEIFSPITIKVINKNKYVVYKTPDGKYYQGLIKKANGNKLVIQPIMNNDSSNHKYYGHYFEKHHDYDNQRISSLYHFINRCDNVMVLAGAGSSISSHSNRIKKMNSKYSSDKYKSGLTMHDLAAQVNHDLVQDDRFSLIDMAEISGFYKIHHLNDTQRENLAFDDFEDLLSNITSFKRFINIFHKDENKTKKYDKTFNDIRKLIYKYCSLRYNSKLFDHANFINLLRSLSSPDERLKIYSTNYDTLFEQAASINGLFVIDGFDYSTHRIFKNNAFNIDFVNRKNDSEEMNTSNTNLLPNVIKIFQLHGSVAWYKENNVVHKANPKIVKYKLTHPIDNMKNNCMIFPGKHKYEQSYTDPYFDMFFQFQRDLHKKNTLLVVIGFSFGDMHIKRMVHDAMQVNDNLNMVFVSFKGLKASLTKSLNNNKEVIITITNHAIGDFCNMSLLSHELFVPGNMDQFVSDLNLGDIYNH